MLRVSAIAVYERKEETGPFKQIKKAVKETDTLFFKNPVFEIFQQKSLSKLEDRIFESDDIMADKSENGFYYMQWIPEDNHLLVLITDRELDKAESIYLLININHADVRPEQARTTLDDIVRNPLGYIGRDAYPEALSKDAQDLKVQAINLRNLVQERGERVQSLADNSESLFISSVEYDKRAEELANSFGCCGGVKNTFNEVVDKIRIANNKP